MISHNQLYREICSFENLLEAGRRAEHGKRMQDTIGRFRSCLEAELLQLHHELVTRTYVPGSYRETIITSPKRRMISAAPFRDRVVHHAVCNVVMPLFEFKMIFDLYSKRLGIKNICAAPIDRQRHRSQHSISLPFPDRQLNQEAF